MSERKGGSSGAGRSNNSEKMAIVAIGSLIIVTCAYYVYSSRAHTKEIRRQIAYREQQRKKDRQARDSQRGTSQTERDTHSSKESHRQHAGFVIDFNRDQSALEDLITEDLELLGQI